MEFRLGRKTRLLWQIRAGVAFLFVTAVFALLVGYSAYFCIPAALSAAAGAVAVVWYIPAFFSGYRIFVGENAVVVTCGVVVVTSRVMPYKRLVFAAGYSTLLARAMSLKGVMLRAARAGVFIPEIEADAADRLIFDIGGEKQRD